MDVIKSSKLSIESPKKLSSKKRWCNNQIPEQLTKEHNMQTKVNNCVRPGSFFTYHEDADVISIYFARVSSGVVVSSYEANNNIIVSCDRDNRIVVVEIYGASELLCCHLLNTQMTFDNRPPLSFYPINYEDHNELKVFFVDSISSIVFQKTKEKDLEVGINDEKKIVVLLFHDAKNRIAKTLPKKERERLAEEARLKSLEFAKWFDSWKLSLEH